MMSLSERLAALPSHKRAKLAAQLPPLSFAQQRLWFLDQLEPNSAFYNIPAAVRLSGQLNIAALERTLTEIVRRHEALRTSFITIDGEARQLIAAPVPFKVPVVDLTTMAAELRSTEAERLARAEATTPFDLSAGELLRVQVLRVAADEHIVLLTLHHIISDGWSMGVLIREVGTLYQAYSEGQESPLEELAIQYGDYARWQREWLQDEVLEQQLGYWREQLAELPVLQIPTDHTRPAVQTYNGSHHHFSLALEVTQQLKDLSQQEGATLFMVLLAGFQLLLSRYSGQEDIVVGTAIAGRNRAETEKLIGCFVNTLVMRTNLSGGPTFKELVRRVREVCLGAYAHQDVPFEKLVEELQPERDLSRSPLFQTMFILQNASVKEQQASGALDMSTMGSETNTAQYDLVLTMIDDGQGTLEYNTDLFEAETVSQMCRHFQRLLTELAADPQQKIAHVPMLSEAEREQILVEWNQTAVEYGPVECLHELFEQQVERTPEATALLFEGQSLNYRELNERANQVARYLRTSGVGPEVLVGVCVSRSIEMVVALLGILKAGGAYVPLDAQYPVERLSFMLADAEVGLLLTESGLREKLPVTDELEVICLDQAGETIGAEGKQNVESGVSGENLAYVIYTSGSTGRPKGVMIPHQCVVNFFTGMDSALDFQEPGVWLALTGISFDISILELFWTLTRGFSVVVHREQQTEVKRVRSQRSASQKPIDFSLFYFASDGSSRAGQRYQLLLEGARFADEHGFSAVWTPERHFHDFGGLYPNPSVSSAAIAAITKHVQIRAGSVVLPLHHPVRVAEEWSMVDNISNGRVGISFASGWHANDFIFTPDRYARRKQIMMEEIETVRRLWRREAVEYTGGGGQPVQIRIMPPPIQPELPVWLTAAGNPETFEMAGQAGANLLTHLLGQSVEDLAGKIKIYRNAWKQAGHSGSGCVSLMLHTFVGERMDEVREQVRAPFTAYLASSLDLMRNLGRSLGINIDDKSLSEDDMAALLSHAFERYFETSGLLGTPEKCLAMLEQLQAIGVDEVACLIDFGVDHEAVLKSLHLLNEVKERSQETSQDNFDQYTIGEQLRTHRVTHVQCTPSMANMLEMSEESRNELGGVEKMLVGGEALSRSLAERLNACLNGRLYNMYGPTETTIWSATSEIKNGEEITIGSPIANTQIYLLDRELEPVAVGVSGELYIGGAGLARAYLNRAGLTAERFIPDPYSVTEGARLYRTGDVARYRGDGRIEYLGRVDEQVKVRGYRIELGEVEAVLERQAGVAECVVVVRGEEADKRLVAYVVAEEGATLSVTELRTRMGEQLPGYMVPGVYVMLPALPLTKNGKVDRRALPEPEASGLERSEQYVAPRTATEEILAGIWQSVLKVERVGVDDNFFELGGHSLLATQLVSRLREVFQVEVSLRSLFSSPTVAGLAGQIDESRHAESAVYMPPAIEPVNRDGDLPLSFAQQRLWFLDQFDPNTSLYNCSAAERLSGSLNLEALERTFTEITRRHEALRTRFVTVDGEARQVIMAPTPFKLPVVDLTGMADEMRSAEAERMARAEASTPFDLNAGELLRVKVLRVAAEEHIVLLTMHHIISDGWSMGVLIREVGTLYKVYSEGQESPLEELAIQYGDYARWQRDWLQGEVLEQQMDYWRVQLAELPVLQMPTDHKRPAVQRYSGRGTSFRIPAAVTQQLKEVSQQEGATLFMVLLAAFQLLLSRYSGQEDVVVGTAIAGRNRAETENLIGCFVNTLVMRTDLSGGPSFKELVKRVREVCLGAYAHQEVPFEKLVEELQPERDLSRSPLFQTLFILQNAPLEEQQPSGTLNMSSMGSETNTSQYDSALTIIEVGGELRATLEYSTDLFEAETIERMCRHFERLLTELAADPQQKIARVPMLSDAEQEQILIQWNQTTVDYGPVECMHELFEQQVERTPEATALVFEEQRLSYRELNERANQLAHYLRTYGVGPEVTVAVCLPRSSQMVVALLGIFKAGGAYVPLDAEYPVERLSFMIADADVSLLLTESRLREQLPVADDLQVIYLDQVAEAIKGQDKKNLESGANGENLAYIIYTSGSTGRPKGVLVTQANLQNTLSASLSAFAPLSTDRIAVVSNFSFDISLFELLLPLLSGGQAEVLSKEHVLDMERLTATLGQLTQLHMVPSLMRQVLSYQRRVGGELSGVRQVFVGGEAVSAELVREIEATFSGAQVYVLYGPTEATIICVSDEVKRGDVGRAGQVIGRGMGNVQVRVQDKWGNVAAVGVVGELLIGGRGVSRGYVKREAETREKFVDIGGERYYRTGDLGRYLVDGRIEYVGRADEQVKVRGFRIELGEVEAVLERQAGVTECVVMARGEEGEKRLVAYVVAEAGASLSVTELRTRMGEQLPSYMVPAAFVMLDSLPLTKNGKVDRRALPEPEAIGLERSEQYVAPRTATEEILAGIWQSVLRVERVGVNDNFFELGGDSIISIQIIARANQAGLALTPRQLFQHQTVAELAAVSGTAPVVEAEQGVVSGVVPLTPIQSWFFSQEQEQPHHFNQSLLFELKEELDSRLLEEALGVLQRHHDALRMRFVANENGWEQVCSSDFSVPFTVLDYTAVSEAQQRVLIEETAATVQASLELTAGPVWRAVQFQLGGGAGRLLLVVHHLVVDGVSWRILLQDLQQAYEQLRSGVEASAVRLPAKSSSFKQWAERVAAQAQSASVAAEVSYWQSAARRSVKRLPVDHEGAANLMSEVQSVTVGLSEEQTRQLLQEVNGAYNTQINDVLLAALGQAVSEWSGSPAVLVELEGHGREEEEIGEVDVTRTVGWFTSVYPALLEVQTPEAGAVLRGVKEGLRQVPRRGLGYGMLRHLNDGVDWTHYPEAEISFNYLGQLDQALSRESWLVPAREASGPSQAATAQRHHLLEINGAVAGGRLGLEWGYSGQQYEAATIERLARNYIRRLEELIAHCVTVKQRGYTPSDFPLAVVGQEKIDELLARGVEIEDLYGLSPMQQGMLFHSLSAPNPEVLFDQSSYRLHGEIDIAAFKQAWQQVVNRHTVLRTSFIWEGLREPVQVVNRAVELDIEYRDWRDLSHFDQEQQLAEFFRADRERGFDLSVAPLMRLGLLRLGESTYEFVWSNHHLVLDGWCLSIILKEVFTYYEAYCQGSQPRMAPSLPYKDYVAWLQKQDLEKANAYWQRILEGFSSPTPLNLGLIDDGSATATEGLYANEVMTLSVETTRQLNAFARQHQLTLNTLVQGAWALILNHYSEQSDVVFGVTVSGRPAELPGVETIMGPCINTLPVRTQVVGEQPLLAWLKGMQEQTLELQQHEYSSLVQQWSDVPLGLPLFESILIFENYPMDAAVQGQGDGQSNQISVSDANYAVRTKYPITLVSGPGNELWFYVAYECRRFNAPGIRQMLDHLKEVMESVAADSEQRIVDLPRVSAEVRAAIDEAQAMRGELRTASFVAPRTPVEEMLTGIVAQVLGQERVGVHDNFFDLGGHSLLGIQLLSRIRSVFGIEVPLRHLFEMPTVAGLAEKIDDAIEAGHGLDAPPLIARPRTEALPLSFAQQRLWFLDQLEPNSAFYNIPAAVRLSGQFNTTALEQTFTEITRRHEVLRTHFATVEGEARQVIADPAPFKVIVVDLTTMTEELRGAEAQRLAQVEAATPFDLSAGELLRVKVLRVASEEHVVLLTMHHIISDGWSMGVLIREVGALYRSYSESLELQLPELTIQYGDYARWQREWLQGEVLEQQLRYWREQLADLPVLEIPTDHTRPAVQSYSGRRATFTIPTTITQQVKDLSQQEGATLFMVLLAAFQLLLSRYSEQEDVVVGTAVAGRNRAETEGLIGCFVNTLVMRTDLTGGPTFKELLKRVREVCLGAYAHQEVPFEKLVEELQPERDPSRSPLVQVAFGLENTPKGEMTAVSALQINSFEFEVEVVRLDLTLWVMDGNNELSLSWTYNTDLFEPATIARMQRHFETLLQSIVEQPEAQIHDLSYISEAEREEQLMRKQERIAANRQQLRQIKRKGVTLTKDSDRINPELIGTLTLQTVTQTEMDHEH